MIEEDEVAGLLAALTAEFSGPELGARDLLQPDHDEGPIGWACRQFQLDATGYLALALALGVEVDGRFARLVAFLNDHPSHSLPTLALLWEVGGIPLGPERLALLADPALRDGLLEVLGDGPLSTRELRVAPAMVARLLGAPDHDLSTTWAEPLSGGLDGLELPEEQRRRAEVWIAAALRGIVLPLVIEGPNGAGRSTLARRLFGTIDLGSVSGTGLPASLRREARWHCAGMIARLPAGTDPAGWWAGFEGTRFPVAVMVTPGQGDALRAVMTNEPVAVRLGIPDPSVRSRIWRTSAVGDRLAPGEADLLAARFPFTPGMIRRAAEKAAIEPRDPESLQRACRDVVAGRLRGLARLLPKVYRRSDLVLSEALEREFSLALSWVKHRKRVLGDWGLGKRLASGWGLTALFAGPPGTGKTMAAQVLGRELDADVYRVDLAQVVSKYIGETPKHLETLLDDAASAGVVLLFDEADALFGRRSEVRDAHDRYANLEIGFLLQRIEDHEGVVLLATNRFSDMDEAFLRRFQFVLTFPMPDRALRERIWHGLLPWSACAGDVDIEDLAERFHLSGGEIRNAVLAAAFLAASDAVPLGQGHLLAALRREIEKSGRVLRASER